MTILSRLSVVLVTLATATSLVAQEGVPDLEKRGDDLYSRRDRPGNAEATVQAYQKALALDPSRSQNYWKLARTYFWIAMQQKGKAAESTFREAIDYAKLCVQTNDADPGCHFWLGASYGKYGENRGVFQSLYLVPFVMQEMERVIELDRTFESAGADLALGRMFYLIPESMPGAVKGDKNKAVMHLRKAVEIAPHNVLARLWLGEALASRGEREEAKKHLQQVLDEPEPRNPVPEEKRAKESATAILKGL
jgi:tetratricopeptide (TPR) repeat protein